MIKKTFILSSLLFAIAVNAQIPIARQNSEADNKKVSEKMSSENLYREAYDLYEQEQYEQALKYINLALKGDGKNLDYYDLKCYILIKLQKNNEIIEAATKAIALKPNDAKFYEIRGNTYYFDFQPEKALVDFRKMISLDKTNSRYYNNYLKLLNEKRLDVEMKNLYPTFVKALPQIKDTPGKSFLHDVYFYFALPFERSGDDNKAIELLTEAIKLKSTGSMYYNNRGLIYQKKGDLKLALKDLNKAIELKPEEVDLYENRFSIYFDDKNYENARKDLLKILALGTSDGSIYVNLGNTYQMQGKSKEAAENYEIALKKSPKDIAVIGNTAYAYYEMGNTKKSLEYFERALQIDAKEIDALVGLAVLYQENRDPMQREKIFKLIGSTTSYQPTKNLLKDLMKESYTYTEKFQKAWEDLF